ncbi:MAG TPA: hypothetical protein PK637_15615 [Flavobacteriales bacterium]|nr:hypothetical protein [Flavobacteriales bacterium]HRE98190.1 hypothetical protein [Flavobacteriales bacterium]HRJ37766.1 hypothetical protein [Flavobacteriales bacterium]
MKYSYNNPQQLTDTAKIWVEDNIIHMVYLRDSEITVEEKKNHHRKFKEVTSEKKMPLLLMFEERVTITKEAREFSKKIEDKQPFTACAVLVNNLAYKILANFYAKFYRPAKPFKVFSDVTKAKDWLRQFIPSATEPDKHS